MSDGAYEREGSTLAALSIAIEKARRGATTAARQRQDDAEARLEELIKIGGIPEEYDRLDRPGNLAVETAFARCYQLVDSDDEREAVVKAFVTWQSDERHERKVVRDVTADALDFVKGQNDRWLTDGCGPSGRAA